MPLRKAVPNCIWESLQTATYSYNSGTRRRSEDISTFKLFAKMHATAGVASLSLRAFSGTKSSAVRGSPVVAQPGLRARLHSRQTHRSTICMSAGDSELVALDELLNKYSGSITKSYDNVSEFLAGYSTTNEEWLAYLDKFSKTDIELGGALVIGGYVLLSAVLGKILFELKGGFAGDLKPDVAADMLQNEKNCILVDVRPTPLRAATGKPALKRRARGKYVVVQGAPMVPLEERRSLRLGKLSELGLRAASTQVLQLKRLSGRVTIILIDQKGNANKLARMVASKHNGDVYQVKGGFQEWQKMMQDQQELPGLPSTLLFRLPAAKEE